MTEPRGSRIPHHRVIAACLGALVTPACAPLIQLTRPTPSVAVVSTSATLPILPVDQWADQSRQRLPAHGGAITSGGRVTLTAANADVRELLPVLAEAAGVNLVLGPDVHGRINVHFVDALASDAIQAVIEQAGLSVGSAQLPAPWGAAIFYDIPVNVNVADSATIASRFGVSAPLARLVISTRPH